MRYRTPSNHSCSKVNPINNHQIQDKAYKTVLKLSNILTEEKMPNHSQHLMFGLLTMTI